MSSGPLRPPVGTEIHVDGRLGSDWLDATRIGLGLGAELLIKRSREALLVGVRQPPGELRYLDVYVRSPSGRLTNFHASMQQGERGLPAGGGWSDSDPPFRWGRLRGWQASVAQRSGAASDRPLAEQLRPYEGYELRLPLGELEPGPWRMRVEVRDFEGRAADLVWPAASARHEVESWALVTP